MFLQKTLTVRVSITVPTATYKEQLIFLFGRIQSNLRPAVKLNLPLTVNFLGFQLHTLHIMRLGRRLKLIGTSAGKFSHH